MTKASEIMSLNEYRDETHRNNQKWWFDINTGKKLDRPLDELLALVHSEISEGLEGLRKDLMDDKLPHREMLEVELADAVIRLLDIAGGFEVDLDVWLDATYTTPSSSTLGGIPTIRSPQPASPAAHLFLIHCAITGIGTCIRLVMGMHIIETLSLINDLARAQGYDLQAAYDEKTAFNLNRADHSHAERLKEGGKKF